VYADLLSDSSFYALLLRIDRDLAAKIRGSGCRFCGAPLDGADYLRKPRGVPRDVDVGPEYAVFFSFCCRVDGCRHRHRPASVRFLDRRVYVGVVMVLAMVLRQGPTRWTAGELRRRIGVSRWTLSRWRRWWLEEFAAGRSWSEGRARFMPPVADEDLPLSLVERFAATGADLRDRMLDLLRFLCHLFRDI
jgi:hypothetical protein